MRSFRVKDTASRHWKLADRTLGSTKMIRQLTSGRSAGGDRRSRFDWFGYRNFGRSYRNLLGPTQGDDLYPARELNIT